MHFQQTAAALAACLSFASAQSVRGFNTGSSLTTGTGKAQSDFQAEFANQRNIVGTNGVFTHTRLYTMIQGGTTSDPIAAIPAAIASNTGLLLGLWASAGQDNFNLELDALRSAIQQYGSAFADIVDGISVGSEDLYRVSPIGIASDAGVGAGPDVIADYIGQVRDVIAGTVLSSAKIGHVDTWTSWYNQSNSAVADACDWVGMDAYPYYESDNTNPIQDAGDLFNSAYDKTQSATGKPVWVTETGYPTSGPTVGEAVASISNARSYWEQVYCTLPADVPLYWYIQVDANEQNSARFGVVGGSLTTTPLYSLSCPKESTSSSSSSSAVVIATAGSKTSSAAVGSATSAASATSKASAIPSDVSSAASSVVLSKITSASAIVIATSEPFTSKSVSLTGSQMVSAATSNVEAPGPLYPSTLTSAPYPTASSGAGVTTAMGSGTGTGVPSIPTSVSTPSPSPVPSASAFNPNGANGAGSTQITTLAFLAVPALLALML